MKSTLAHFVIGLLLLAPAAFGAEIQLLVFAKASEAKKPELTPVPTAELADHLRPLQPALESKNLPLSSEVTEVKVEWQANHAQQILTFRTKLEEQLRFDLFLETKSTQTTYFGSSAAPRNSHAAGSLELPEEVSYLIDAGDVLIALAPAQSVPTAAESAKVSNNP